MGVNVVKCQNGHFYDSGKYSACPHCGVQVDKAAANQPEKKESKGSPFWKRVKKDEPESAPAPVVKEVAAAREEPVVKMAQPVVRPEEKDDDLTQAILKKRAEEERDANGDTPTVQYWEDKTVAMVGEPVKPEPERVVPERSGYGRVVPERTEPERVASERTEPARVVPEKIEPVSVAPERTEPVVKPESEVLRENKSLASSLQERIQQASAGNEGKTIGVFSMGHSAAPVAPAPAVKPAVGATAPAGGAPVSGAASVQAAAPQAPVYDGPVDPVVGWLVCIHGKHFGESFNLAAGRNSIGRSANNHIVLWKDNSVSREKHAMVIYEPKKRNFYVQPGDSSGLTYLNDDYITESKKLASGDIVELGDCQFIFIPLCGENFTWEDYISKE